MRFALFINGVYEGVLAEILVAQEGRGGSEFFLQPYSRSAIAQLRNHPPSSEEPVRLYLSTTGNLNQICYAAEIVRWEDKHKMSPERHSEVRRHLEEHQPGEVPLFVGDEEVGRAAVNVITIRGLRLLESRHSTALLRKTRDGLPLGKRTRSGNWIYVHEVEDLICGAVEIREFLEADLAEGLRLAGGMTDAELGERLSAGPTRPERVQVVSAGFRRNPYVIEAVLRRAGGVCESCGSDAPFLRRSDGSPYLEVHHLTPLSEDGDDTVANSAALCPNCHRREHHGPALHDHSVGVGGPTRG